MRNVDCTNMDVFKPFFGAYYFNCFSFDAASLFTSSTTRMFGLENGLTLMLFVDSAGHVRVDGNEGELMLPGTQKSDLTLASGRGVRVIVHTPGKVEVKVICESRYRCSPTCSSSVELVFYTALVGYRNCESYAGTDQGLRGKYLRVS